MLHVSPQYRQKHDQVLHNPELQNETIHGKVSGRMENTLNSKLQTLTTELCNALAEDQKIIAAKARIALFFSQPEATTLFQEVNAFGEELRNKHLAGMPPSEEEINKFEELRQAVIANETARGFLEARQEIDEVLGAINQNIGMTMDLGRAPTPEEVIEAASKQAQGGCCGGSCGGEGGCDGDCDCGDDCECGENSCKSK